MGLWSDIVRRGTTGEVRQEDKLPISVLISPEYPDGSHKEYIGICGIPHYDGNLIHIHYAFDLAKDELYLEQQFASNYKHEWHIRPAIDLEVSAWMNKVKNDMSTNDLKRFILTTSNEEDILNRL